MDHSPHNLPPDPLPDPPPEQLPTHSPSTPTAAQTAKYSSKPPPFEPLEGAQPSSEPFKGSAEGSGPEFTGLSPTAPPQPFTSEEIVGGAVQGALFSFAAGGLQLSEHEQQVFVSTFQVPNPQLKLSLVKLCDALQIGEALARYGIHQDMAVGKVLENMANMPDWVRLIICTSGFGASAYIALLAVRNDRLTTARSVDPGPGGAGFATAQPDEARDHVAA